MGYWEQIGEANRQHQKRPMCNTNSAEIEWHNRHRLGPGPDHAELGAADTLGGAVTPEPWWLPCSMGYSQVGPRPPTMRDAGRHQFLT